MSSTTLGAIDSLSPLERARLMGALQADVMRDKSYQLTPLGMEAAAYLRHQAEQAGLIVAAWGAHKLAAERARDVLPLLGLEIHCLRLTQDGAPGHPLYVPDATRPMPLPGWPDSTS